MVFAKVLLGAMAWLSVLVVMMAIIFFTMRRCARAIGRSTWSAIEAYYQTDWDMWFGRPGDIRSRIRAQIAGTRWRNILWAENAVLALIFMFGPVVILWVSAA